MKNPVSSELGVRPIEPAATGSSRINVGSTERILSAAGGALLFTFGLRSASLGGFLLAAAGSYLAYRGTSGYCPINEAIGRNTAEEEKVTDVIEITQTLKINRPRKEVYQYWRQLENLPRFMSHLKEVKQLDPTQSHWVAQVSDGKLAQLIGTVEWDAIIVEEVENEWLAWKSIEGAQIANSGEVHFVDAPGKNEDWTILHATIQYRPPAGQLGEVAAKLFNSKFEQIIKDDLNRFKELIETGQIIPVQGQSVFIAS